MTDISNSLWDPIDAANVHPSPDGIAKGDSPNNVPEVMRAMKGGIKRAYQQSNALFASSGTGNSYVLTYPQAPEDYVKGVVYWFFADKTNTGSATLGINGLGSRAILNAGGQALTAGQIQSGVIVCAIYDGSAFRMQFTHSNPKFTGTLTADAISTTGTVSAASLSGDGAAITALNASSITTGTIADARLPATMSGKTFTGPVGVTGGSISISENYPEIRLTRTPTNAWRSTVDTGNGSFVIQHSNNAFASNFVNALVLNTTGSATINGSTVWTQGNLPTPVAQATQVSAGNGLIGGGTLAANRTLTLGTPTAISGSSTNSVTTTSHTHQLLLSAADISGALGYVPGKGDGVPVGGMIMLYGNDSAAPDGFLLANGAAVTSTYPELRAFGLARGWAVNSNGDPLLPDMGGYFARGWRTGQTVDSGRAFGSVQQDAMQGHKHSQQDDPTRYGTSGGGSSIATGALGPTSVGPYVTGGPYTDGVNGTPRTASETRPINVTVTYWIKAFAAGQTSGTADLTQLGNDITAVSARATTLEANGRTPVFVCFNGTGTIAIRKSFGVSSLVDLGTGRYKINFSVTQPDASYAFSTTGLNGQTTQILWGCAEEVTASSITVRFVNKNIGLNDDNPTDPTHVSVIITSK